MKIIAGIDEAGYGPRLGPLVVSATAFAVHGIYAAVPDLWRALAPVVTQRPVRHNDSIVVGDSKRLYTRAIGLKYLETAALTFLGAVGQEVSSREALLGVVSLSDVAEPCPCPWHVGSTLAVPVEVEPMTIRYKTERLRAQLAAPTVQFRGVKSIVMSASEFNARVQRSGNKARTLFEAVGALLRWVARCAEGVKFQVYVDKQGGRDHYDDLLKEIFPGAQVSVAAESETLSIYSVSGGSLDGVIAFAVDSEDQHLPVALASMYSKYLRELDLRLFNQFWLRRVPGLRPTAGYGKDAQRFIQQIMPAIQAGGFDRETIVRIR